MCFSQDLCSLSHLSFQPFSVSFLLDHLTSERRAVFSIVEVLSQYDISFVFRLSSSVFSSCHNHRAASRQRGCSRRLFVILAFEHSSLFLLSLYRFRLVFWPRLSSLYRYCQSARPLADYKLSSVCKSLTGRL